MGAHPRFRRISLALLLVLMSLGTTLAQEQWEKDHEGGVKAAKEARFAVAEELLLKSATEARRDAQVSPLLGRSLLDLAEVYRTEGKYGEAQANYDESRKIFLAQYGPDSLQVAEALDREAKLFGILGDYVHAESGRDLRQDRGRGTSRLR